MKNYMKKIIVGFFALAVLFTAHSASATWNNLPADCPTPLTIGNYSTGDGIQNGPNGCWTKTSISANAGQVVNIAVFYDNTNGVDAHNTTIRITQSPSGGINNPSSTFTFSGNLTSSAGNLSLNQVTANLTSSQPLVFGQAKLFVHGTGSGVSLPNGQTGYEAFNGNGLNLGTIAKDDWGNIVFSFTVGTNGNTQTCQDPNASNYGGSLPCQYYNNNNCTISTFTIDGSSSATVSSGSRANLEWETNDCTSVYVSGPNFSSSSLDGDRNVYPTYSGTYTITAHGNNGGTRTRTVYVYVDEEQNNCRINSFTVNGSTQTTIQSGSAANIYWSTTDCTSVYVSGPGMNSNSRSSNQTVYPTVNSNYTITAYGNNSGTQTRSVYVNVNPTVVVNNTCAVTTVATNVGQNSATLNGLVTGSTGPSYFEYGTDVTLGSRTVARNASGAFTEFIGGLSSNTNYYFRFVSQCSGGISYGSIEFFRTGGIVRNNTTTIVQGTTVIGTQSPIMLKIENRFQYVGVGDVVDYMVTYKNIGKTTLNRPVLQVIVPKGFTLINTSRGTFSQETNTLTVPLEDLLPGAEGVVYLQALVNSLEIGNAQIVSTAILVYTSPSGAQENAIAYVLNSPRNVNVLGASAFWSGLWGIGLIGWLLIFILILLIILATRSYRRKSTIHSTNPITGSHTTTTTNY